MNNEGDGSLQSGFRWSKTAKDLVRAKRESRRPRVARSGDQPGCGNRVSKVGLLEICAPSRRSQRGWTEAEQQRQIQEHKSILFEIGADDCNEFLCALALSGRRFGGEDVVANMSFHHLVHEPIHGAARRSNQLKNFGAVPVQSERLLNGLDLSLDSMDPCQELPFGFGGM
jgi:hypothetical protein